jgi:hypothetical protein
LTHPQLPHSHIGRFLAENKADGIHQVRLA